MSLSTGISDFVAAVRTKLNSMTPRLLPAGGASGQVLAKSGAGDFAATWVTPAAGDSEQSDLDLVAIYNAAKV